MTGGPGTPVNAQFPIAGFQVNLVGPGGSTTATFTSGAGELSYSVSSGSNLSAQNGGVGAECGQYEGAITGENSNVLYGDITPSSGSTVTQTLNVPVAAPAIPTTGGRWALVQGSGFFVTGTIYSAYIHYLYNNNNFYRALSKGFEWYIQSDTDIWVLIPPLDDDGFLTAPPALTHPSPAPITTTIQTAYIELYRSPAAFPPAPPDVISKITYEYLPRVETVNVSPVLWTGQPSSPGTATLDVITPPNQSVSVNLSATPSNNVTFNPNPAAVPSGGNEPPVANFIINTASAASEGAVTIQACVATNPLSDSPCSSTTTQVFSGNLALIIISSTPSTSPFGPSSALASGAPITFGIYLRNPTPSTGPVSAPVLNISWKNGNGRYTTQFAPIFGNAVSSTTFILTPFVTSGFQVTLSISVTYADQGSSNTLTVGIAKPPPTPPPPPPRGGQI